MVDQKTGTCITLQLPYFWIITEYQHTLASFSFGVRIHPLVGGILVGLFGMSLMSASSWLKSKMPLVLLAVSSVLSVQTSTYVQTCHDEGMVSCVTCVRHVSVYHNQRHCMVYNTRVAYTLYSRM